MSFESPTAPAAMEISPPLEGCWFLTGHTASGKTSVGVELAEMLGAEIVSLDSMALYRGMDIGTAKPAAGERTRVPHHLIDVVDPCEEFSLSQYVTSARSLVEAIQGRARKALFVGGTPLYLKALLRGVVHGPPADWDFRRQMEEESQRHGFEALHQRLSLVDPLAAARLHPRDTRRVIRALEVYRHTGQPLSHQQTQFDDAPNASCRVMVLDWPREKLHARIEERVHLMFTAGLVEETRRLLERHGSFSRTALQAVGYATVLDHLAGKIDLDTCREQVVHLTRQFAKRQETWFRSLAECVRVPQNEARTARETAAEILSLAAPV